MGMTIDVFRRAAGGDCSLGGVSSRYNQLVAVNVPGPFRPRPDAPAVLLLDGPGGGWNPILIPAVAVNTDAEEGDGVEYVEATGTWAFGGNYAGTSDSRFSESVRTRGSTVIRVHDRDMTKEKHPDV